MPYLVDRQWGWWKKSTAGWCGWNAISVTAACKPHWGPARTYKSEHLTLDKAKNLRSNSFTRKRSHPVNLSTSQIIRAWNRRKLISPSGTQIKRGRERQARCPGQANLHLCSQWDRHVFRCEDYGFPLFSHSLQTPAVGLAERRTGWFKVARVCVSERKPQSETSWFMITEPRKNKLRLLSVSHSYKTSW